MPSLENIAGVVAGSGARHIAVEQARCVRVRHRRASCARCLEACPEEALSIEGNAIELDPVRCTGCGACASVCPTQALSTVRPSARDLLSLVDELSPRTGSEAPGSQPTSAETDGCIADYAHTLEFACAHALPSSIGNRIVVPTLSYVDEGALVHAAVVGFRRIVLTSCPKRTCLEIAVGPASDALDTARALLGAWSAPCELSLRRQKADAGERASGHAGNASGGRHVASPASGKEPDDWDPTRRNALSDAMSQARTIIAETASAEMRDRMGMADEPAPLSRVLTDGAGNLKKFPMPRMEQLVDDLFVLNPEPSGELRARGFTRVEVNGNACSRCGICPRFCPTGALEGEAVPIGNSAFMGARPPAEDDVRRGSLSFRTSDCVGCRLCEDVCPLHCLHVKSRVEAESVFQLEPTDLLA